MFYKLLFLSVLSSCLFSQEFYSTFNADRDLTLCDFSIVEWNPKQNIYSLRKDLPSIPKVSRGRAIYQFDGQHLYMVEAPGNIVRILFGFPLTTPTGPQWFLHPHISIKGDLRFLGADNLRIILERRTRPEGKNPGKYQIQTFDLISEKIDTIFEEEFRSSLIAVSIVKDHTHIVFLSDGRILHIDSQFGTIKETASRFWQTQSDKYIEFVERLDGKKIAQQPFFPGNPFFTRDGDICVPMVIRESNIWTLAMRELIWAEAPTEDRERAIKQGLWPPKTDEFIGSDNAFVVLRYNPETHQTTVIPAGKFEWLIERTPYVKQARLAKMLPNPLFFGDKEGVAEVCRSLEPVTKPEDEKPKPARP